MKQREVVPPPFSGVVCARGECVIITRSSSWRTCAHGARQFDAENRGTRYIVAMVRLPLAKARNA